jgi:hypothetical protein
MGVPIPSGLDGRVLEEALVGGPEPGEMAPAVDTLAARVDLGDSLYGLAVRRTRVGSKVYFDGTDVTHGPRGR